MAEKKSHFDKAVEKLAEQMEGKVLRKEWSLNRLKLKKELELSTQELHRAFKIVGRMQKVAEQKPAKKDRPTPKNKAEWQELYREVFGSEPDGLTVAVMKDAIDNNEPIAIAARGAEGDEDDSLVHLHLQ
jgi:hypothetical protein